MGIATDQDYMQQAMAEAASAERGQEVPVGAIVVNNHQVIGRGFNRSIGACDPTAHAEIMALRDAAKESHNYRLVGATLYVTLEPCLMCWGAMVHARIDHLVFGAWDPKSGVLSCAQEAMADFPFNHRFTVQGGVLASDCGALLKHFFMQRRGPNTQ